MQKTIPAAHRAREAAELRANAITALRRGDVDTARYLVALSDELDPPEAPAAVALAA